MKKIFCLLIVLSLLIVGCQKATEQTNEQAVAQENLQKAAQDTQEGVEAQEEQEPEVVAPSLCTHNANCTQGLQCVEGKCITLADLYKTQGCTQTCKIKSVTFTDDLGIKTTLKAGESTYSYAGSMNWALKPTPAYCKGEQPLVPVGVEKVVRTQVYGDEILTLKQGVTSKVLTHPTIKRVQFTLRVDSVEEACE